MHRDTTNPYEFQEHPKWVPGRDGKSVLVNNAEEEAQVSDTGEEPVREADERIRLTTVAEINGVQIDKRWGLEKIAKAIEDAGHDPHANPFE